MQKDEDAIKSLLLTCQGALRLRHPDTPAHHGTQWPTFRVHLPALVNLSRNTLIDRCVSTGIRNLIRLPPKINHPRPKTTLYCSFACLTPRSTFATLGDPHVIHILCP